MKREEAIKDLDIIRFNPHWDELVNEEYWQELMEMAIKALEEVQQYRKHGLTVENALDNMCDLAAAENLIEEYRAIGTPEECRTAVKKQTAKKPTFIDYKKYVNFVDNAHFLRDAYWCPNCKQVVRSGSFCNGCGQKLDWSGEE